jgi:23S rRNA pseudouridine955/2504/2580 synthase
VKEYTISVEFNQVRIDRWLRYHFDNLPQSLIEKSLRNGKIKNQTGKIKSSYRLTTGEKIIIYLDLHEKNKQVNNEQVNKISSHKHDRDYKNLVDAILFENENYLILNKPRGFSVQGGTNVEKSIIDIIKYYRPEDDFKIVHRIDKETSGILILAKNLIYARFFAEQFRLHQIKKTYLAVCEGKFKKPEGSLVNFIEKIGKIVQESQNGKEARSFYKVLSSNNGCSLVHLEPQTGRMHQLRVQLALCGHPIVGDAIYNDRKYSSKDPMLLHAAAVEFIDLDGKACVYNADLPVYFNELLGK